MSVKIAVKLYIAIAALVTFAACGGGGGGSTPAPVAPAPVAAIDTATTVAATAVTIPVLTNDTNATPGVINSASVNISTQSLNGTAVANVDGTVTFTPATGFSGTTTFAYTVKNSSIPALTSNAATVTVTVSPAIPPAKTTAVLKIGTQGVLGAGVSLYGVGVIVTLPQGVTVATDGSGNVGGSVAIVSGVASGGTLAPPVYTPANRTIKLVVAAGATGFSTGEFVTVTCILPAGNNLQASDFTTTILSNLEPADQSLAPVAGLTPTITAILN